MSILAREDHSNLLSSLMNSSGLPSTPSSYSSSSYFIISFTLDFSFFVTLLVSFLVSLVLLVSKVLLVSEVLLVSVVLFVSVVLLDDFMSFLGEEELEVADASDPTLSSISFFYYFSHPLVLFPSVRSLTGLVSSSVPSSPSAVELAFALIN